MSMSIAKPALSPRFTREILLRCTHLEIIALAYRHKDGLDEIVKRLGAEELADKMFKGIHQND